MNDLFLKIEDRRSRIEDSTCPRTILQSSILNPRSSISIFLPLTLSLILVLAACDNSFEPINEEPTDFFAIFGFLDTAADTQFVRVSPLRETLEPSGDLAARVGERSRVVVMHATTARPGCCSTRSFWSSRAIRIGWKCEGTTAK